MIRRCAEGGRLDGRLGQIEGDLAGVAKRYARRRVLPANAQDVLARLRREKSMARDALADHQSGCDTCVGRTIL